MNEIIEVDPREAIEWLSEHSDWEFVGKINTVSHKNLLELVNKLYEAGSERVYISEYNQEIEPVYEGDEFLPDMLIIKLPEDINQRQAIFGVTNTSMPELKRHTYKDAGLSSLWYFFEPEPHKITVSNKEVTWYS